MTDARRWNWQKKGWPNFRHDSEKLAPLEAEFLQRSGVFMGATLHVSDDEKRSLMIDLIANEALGTSEIEDELLSRDSLQSSLRRQFGLPTDNRKIPPAEAGISEMMVRKKLVSTVTLTTHQGDQALRKDGGLLAERHFHQDRSGRDFL